MSNDGEQTWVDQSDALQSYVHSHVRWDDTTNTLTPWTANNGIPAIPQNTATPPARQPIDIPLGLDRQHQTNVDTVLASSDLGELDDSWFDDAAFSLYIENDMLSELPQTNVTEYQQSHWQDASPSWASHTGWMSGLNTIPTFSYIEAHCSNPSNQTDSKKRKRTTFDESQVQIMQDWLDLHTENPYPTEEDLLSLCASTRLEMKQVRNWFARTRQRKLARHRSPAYQAPWTTDQDHTRPQFSSTMSSASGDSKSPSSITALLSLDVRAGSSVPSADDSDFEMDDLGPSLDFFEIPNTSAVKLQSHDSVLEWWLDSIRTDVPSHLERFPEVLNFPFDDVFDDNNQHLDYLPLISTEFTQTNKLTQGAFAAEQTSSATSYEDRTGIQQRLRTHIGYLLRRGKDSAFPNTPGSSHASLQSLLRQSRHRSMIWQSGGLSSSLSVDESSDYGKSLFSHQSFGSKVSLQSAATSFSFGSRRGRKPQYQSSSTELHEKAADPPIENPSVAIISSNKNQCRFCSKTFSRLSAVVRHEKAVHAPDHWFICEFAGPSSTQSCPVCSSSASITLGKCVHELGNCNGKSLNDRVFLRRDNFQDHLRRVHNLTRSECCKLDLSRWQHDQGDIAAILDTQMQTRAFHDGLKQLDQIPARPREWGVVLKGALEEEVYDAEDIATELDCQRLPPTSSAPIMGKFTFRGFQHG